MVLKNSLIFFFLVVIKSSISLAKDNDVILKTNVVDGVVSITKEVGRKMGNLYPWQISSCPSEKVNNSCSLVSNSCGFAKAKYSLGDGKGSIDVYVRLGEWCGLGSYVYDRPTFLILREWEGKYYLIDSVGLVVDGKGQWFIPPSEFISDNNLESFYTNVVSGEGVCMDLEDLSPYQLSAFKESGRVKIESTKACWLSGVSLDQARRFLEHLEKGD